ncbi:MAG TPA: helix-turn-helix domain-containing protein [Actinocrinis sp.]|nr:helix-turn-helix domain-containing protein [Actinocrinis sp.]
MAFDELGAVALLAVKLTSAEAFVPDVRNLNEAESAVPGTLATLAALTVHDSVRKAAAELHIHHSTLQARLVHANTVLGYEAQSTTGRARLSLALAPRRIHLNGDLP